MTLPYLDGEPVISMRIKGPLGQWRKFWGYLDSGAGYSVFHIDVAEMLGIDIYKGREINLTVGDGSKITAYVHKISVRFAEKEFTADIAFSSGLGIGTNIIGMKSFFDKFCICFNNKKQEVDISFLK